MSKGTNTMNRIFFSGALAAAVLTLAACGGGGGGGTGGGGGGILPGGPTPTPTPIVTPTPAVANATGKVVDLDSNAPISGAAIKIATYTAGAAATSEGSTAADGTFAFSATPGVYLLTIGSDSSSDTAHATWHSKITLVAGANPLTVPTLPAEANVVYTTAQNAGTFRLATLSAGETDCSTGANTGRTGAMPKFVVDEALTENARAFIQEEIAQGTDTPSPLFGNDLLVGVITSYSSSAFAGGTTSSGFSPCSLWTGTSYSYVSGNPPYPFATNSANIWYGASYGGASNYGMQGWLPDPR